MLESSKMEIESNSSSMNTSCLSRLDLLSLKAILLEHFMESNPGSSDTGSSSQSIESPSSSSNANEETNQAKVSSESVITFSDIVAHFRQKLVSGHGETILYLGLDDDEINEKELLLCLDRLDSIASVIPCKASILHVEGLTVREKVKDDPATLSTTASSPPSSSSSHPRKKSTKVCSASVLFRLCPESMQDLLLEVRVAVVGNVDAGKSTTLGVLTKGTQDDGRGKAREDLFRHKHEATTGRTSSVGLEILGFDAHGNVIGPPRAHPFLNESVVTVGQALQKVEAPITNSEKDLQNYRKMPWDSIMLQSTKILTFIDLAGHEKYLKTTVFGMTGHSPDFVMLMIGSNSGIIGMTKEHLGLSVALNVPFFCVITKVDMCPPNVLEETIAKLSKLLKSPGCKKSPVFVKEPKDVAVVANHFVKDRLCPIFQISNVTGSGLGLLKTFLNLLPSYKPFTNDGPTEYQITDTYSVPGVGTVVSGTMISGQIKAGQNLYYGPDCAGEFHSVLIKSIQRKRVGVAVASAGHCVSFALKKVKRSSIRKGMVLVDKDALPGTLPSPHLSELVTANPDAKFPSSRFGYVSNCFEAEILILKHSTTIRKNYQSMLHCGTIRQTVQLTHTAVVPNLEPQDATTTLAAKDSTEPIALRTGDQSVVRFKFVKYPEYLQLGKRLIFREGQTRGVGKIVRVLPPIT